jgi:hypothetical protein
MARHGVAATTAVFAMTIVVDIGAARYGNDYSIERLIEEFHPEVLYGFDPMPFVTIPFASEIIANSGEGTYGEYEVEVDGCRVIVQGRAAWVYDGEIGLFRDGLSTHVVEDPRLEQVACFDLAGFLCEVDSRHVHPSQSPAIILKIDAETAEYTLLEHLIATGHDRWLKLAWIEWHCLTCGRGAGGHRQGCRDRGESAARREQIEREISCELAEWRW